MIDVIQLPLEQYSRKILVYRKLGMQQKLDKLAVTREVSHDRGNSAG